MRACLIAGTHSGCGKTTFTMGLLALLCRRGLRVAPFKAGPDFIDPMFHEAVTGFPSHNLDSWMLSPAVVRALFTRHAAGADIAVAEGVMGLHDGMGAEGLGSSAELAGALGLPVFLVVDCQGLYQSVSAQVAGYRALDPRADLRGVLLNNVGSAALFGELAGFIRRHTGLEALGWLPPDPRMAVGSRHLGLVQAGEIADLAERAGRLADLLAKNLDLPRLLALSEYPGPGGLGEAAALEPFRRDLAGLRLAVARDRAFGFYYRDNLELLAECGAEILPFSPLVDSGLPAASTALYIGGGYPEVFAEGLAANQPMRDAIRKACAAGLPAYAECGGLMYLCSSLRAEGKEFPMAGVFNAATEMTPKLQRFGYARLAYGGASGPCHEFHRSRLVPPSPPQMPDYHLAYRLSKPDRDQSWDCGLARGRVLAGYAHVHFFADPALSRRIFRLLHGTAMD